MDWVRLGLSLRALRRRRGWTQAEVAARVGCSRSLIALVEGGAGYRLAGRSLARITAVLGARLRVQVMWHGEDLDRLLDRRHAGIVEAIVRRLESLGWLTLPEVTFQIGSERGSIDVLAIHPPSAALLVIEVKSVVPDIQATLVALDRKARLAPRIAAERQLRQTSVSRLLVLPEGATTRRRVRLAAATLKAAYPARNVEVSRWLQVPNGSLSGILFLSNANPGDVRRRSSPPANAATHADGPRSSQTSTNANS